MLAKDRYLLLELIVTFLMISLSLILLDLPLFPLQKFAFIGFACGFFLSWSLRYKSAKLFAVLINLASFCVIVWALSTVLHSAFSWKETIITCIKSILVIVFFFSFNCFHRSKISYIQLLIIPVFIAVLIFSYKLNIVTKIAVVIYCIFWLIIFRIKFISSIPVQQAYFLKKKTVICSLVIIVFFSLILSWLFTFRSSYWQEYKKTGAVHANFFGSELLIEKTENDYYDLQDYLNRKIIEIISVTDNINKKKSLLTLLNSFLSEESSMELLEEKQSKLLEYIPNDNLQLKGFDTELLKQKIGELADKKVKMNFYKAAEELTEEFQRQNFSLKEKISGLRFINQMKYAKDSSRCRLLDKQIKDLIKKSGIPETSKMIPELLSSRLKDWKEYLVYLKGSQLLKNKISLVNGALKERLFPLLVAVNNVQDLTGFSTIEIRLNKESVFERQDIVGRLKKLSIARLGLVEIASGNNLMKKTEDLTLNPADILLAKYEIDKIKNSFDIDTFLEESAKFNEVYKKSASSDFQDSLRQFLETKFTGFYNTQMTLISDELKKSVLPDNGRVFLDSIIQSLDKSVLLNKFSYEKKQVLEELDRFQNQGLINLEGKAVLAKSIADIFKLYEFISFSLLSSDETMSVLSASGIIAKMEGRISASVSMQSLSDELTRLIKEMDKSNNMERLNDLFNATQSIIKKIESHGAEHSFIETIKDNLNSLYAVKKVFIIEQAFKNTRVRIEDIRMLDPQKADKLEAEFERVKQSFVPGKTVSEMNSLLVALASLASDEKALSKQESPDRVNRAFHVYVYPSVVVLAVNSRINLKAILSHGNTLKEVQDAVEWISPNPNIAYVGNTGIVYAVSEGATEITAVYRGIPFEKAKIFVRNGIEEKEKKEIMHLISKYKESKF